MQDVRIDKWLWAARFFKTRSLAQTAIETGRALVGGERVKLARAVHLGDKVIVRIGDIQREVVVMKLSDQRGSAPVAQTLYEETSESIRVRVEAVARKALYKEPSFALDGGRPTKRNRRDLERVRSEV